MVTERSLALSGEFNAEQRARETAPTPATGGAGRRGGGRDGTSGSGTGLLRWSRGAERGKRRKGEGSKGSCRVGVNAPRGASAGNTWSGSIGLRQVR